MRHSLCWLPVLNLKKSTSSESSSVSISLSLLYPTLSPDSTLSCQRLRTRGPQIAAAAAAAAIAGGEGIKMCSLSLPLSPLSFSLSLCCAQRMFIQALSSQLSVDWAFHQSHTAWNQAAWAKPHRGERQKECGFVCLRMGLCMLDQKRGKTMGKKALYLCFSINFYKQSVVLFIMKSLRVSLIAILHCGQKMTPAIV